MTLCIHGDFGEGLRIPFIEIVKCDSLFGPSKLDKNQCQEMAGEYKMLQISTLPIQTNKLHLGFTFWIEHLL